MTTTKPASALDRLLLDIRRHYGDRLKGIYRIDRADLLEDEDRSDAEIVVILADGAWRNLDEMRELSRMTFDVLMDAEVYIRAWPISLSAWNEPTTAAHPGLVDEFRTHAEPILEAA